MDRRLIVCSLALVVGCQSAAPSPRDDVATTQPASATQPAARASRRPQRVPMEHKLVRIDTDDELRDGQLDHAALVADLPTTRATTQPQGVRIVSPRNDFPFVGTWTSETREAEWPFTELLPSWNVDVPEGTGVRFEVRVREAEKGAFGTKDGWSPWLYIGYWGRITRDRTKLEFDGGKIDEDTLELTKPADAFEVRATLYNYDLADRAKSPTLRRVRVAYSRPSAASAPAARAALAPTTIPVPFRAQGVEDKAIRHSVCSPTSVTMVLGWAGRLMPTADNALAIWDDDNAIFGNWNRAVQFAGSLGYDAWLQRFNSMDEVRAMLATGQPIVASIRFKRGEFPSNVSKQTAGHLIVVRGFDSSGDLICNDPASKDRGEAITYKADELARAWLLNTGGVGYVIRKP